MNTSASVSYVEPWLSGTHADIPAIGRAVLHAFDLALDDITKWTESLSDLEVHAQPLGLPAVSFHLRHIARSTDRLLTYAEGGQISGDQLALLKSEQTGCETLAELLAEVETSFSNAADRVRVLATADFNTFSRSGPQAVADLDRGRAGSCSRPYAAACGAGRNHRQGAEGSALAQPTRDGAAR